MREGDAEKIEEIVCDFLSRTISVFDIKGPEKEKEKYYHVFLTGILLGNPDWGVSSQRESGDGLPDIIVRPQNPDEGIVIEIKSMDKVTQLERGAEEALGQIRRYRYYAALVDDGRCDIWAYGIAFHKKRCFVRAEKLKF